MLPLCGDLLHTRLGYGRVNSAIFAYSRHTFVIDLCGDISKTLLFNETSTRRVANHRLKKYQTKKKKTK
jgi:hypothetical protein